MHSTEKALSSTERFICRAKNLINEKYEEKFVCFVDVQGTKSDLEKSMNPIDVALPNLIFNHAKEANDEYDKKIQMVIFSDCAYIVADKNNIEEFLLYISLLYFEFLTSNNSGRYRLLRGGITFGKVYCNPELNCIVGPSVVVAYNMDDSDLPYPRIILDDASVSAIGKIQGNLQCLPTDPIDNIYYLDFLAVVKKHRGIIPNMLVDSLQWIEEVLRTEKKERTLKKYKWMKKYMDNTMREWKSIKEA